MWRGKLVKQMIAPSPYYKVSIELSINECTYLVNVAHTKSAGNVAGRDRVCNSFAPRCLKIQFANPLLADSMYVWKTVKTVSGMLSIKAS